MTDAATGQTIFSRGFASIYGEWETTAEAKKMNRTFSESLRFPLVDKPVRIVVKKRDARNAFIEVWSLSVDPNDKFIERGAVAAVRPGRCSSFTRAAIPRPSSTCWCCATATPRASEGSSSAMPGGSLRRCSRRRRSRSVRETSTSGDFVRHHSNPGSAVRHSTSFDGRLWARPTMRSTRNVTSSRSKTGRSATSLPMPLRCRGDPREQLDVRRRRNLRAVRNGCAPTAPGRRISSYTSLDIISPRWPTSTTRRMWPIFPPRTAWSRGSPT